MSRRKSNEENVRKITKSGDSYAITLPIDMVRKLKWKEKQKVVLSRRGKVVTVRDWIK